MTNLVGVVNYGTAGNTHSVMKALQKAGGQVILINNPADFERVTKLVLPGVGSFKEGMEELETDGFIKLIQAFDGPVLGICLGMQMLSTLGYEYGLKKGLNLIEAEVKPIECSGKVPHVGFREVNVIKDSVLFKGVEKDKFYFMHSYEMVTYKDILSLSEYAGHQFVSAVEKNNIFGVQFHPEKSRESGIKLFKNFLSLDKVN